MEENKEILQVKDLAVAFQTYRGKVKAVRNVSFALKRGQALGIVGESGCGKSVTAHAIMGLLPKENSIIENGQILWQGQDLVNFQDEDLAGVVYSTPYIDDFGYALIAAKTTTLKEIKDYSGKKIGVLQGDPDAKAFAQKTFPNSTLIELSDASINGKRIWLSHFIGNGTVDAIVYDYPFGVSELEGTNLQFVISKLPESNLKYKIALRENNPVLLDKLNAAIRSVKSSNAYADLLKKYFLSDKLLQTKIGVDEKTYVVKSGDTLSTIAQQLLGDKLKYTIIETRNNLPNPNLISVGQKLIIPANK